jgi:hypothetical protein
MKTRLVSINNQTAIDSPIYLTTISGIGPPGLSDLLFLTRIADGNIGGQRMVIGNADGTCSYAHTTNVTHIGKVLGMSNAAYLDGENVKIIREGLVEFVGWSFDVDLPIYLGINGLLTQSASATGFSQIVGFAESPTKLFVNLREPILL